MQSDKKWKIITMITILCGTTFSIYKSSRTNSTNISTNLIPPLQAKKFIDPFVQSQNQEQEDEVKTTHHHDQDQPKDATKFDKTGKENWKDPQMALYLIEEKVRIAINRIKSSDNPGISNEISQKDVTEERSTTPQAALVSEPHEDNDDSWIPAGIFNMAPSVFQTIPRKFLPQYKSPCWHDEEEVLYCLPYFYIIGTAKCGTTELWDKITQHPDVVESVPKEPHWWARRRLGWKAVPIHGKQVNQIRKLTGDKDDSSVQWYLNWCKTFGVTSIESHPTKDSDGRISYPRVFGDASVSTSFDMFGTWGSKERNYTTADLIHAVQPQAKIIMIVRDPVERFFSMFNYNGQYREKSPNKFDKLANDATQCFKRCVMLHSERFCIFARQCDIVKGVYITVIKEWMRVYGREGVYVLRLEDWYENVIAEFKKVLRFLDLSPLSDNQILEITSRKAKNVNNGKTKRPEMWDTTRKVLQDFFRPYNKRLADLLNNGLYAYDG